MDFIIWLLVSGVSGWIAGRVVGSNTRQALLRNLSVGVLGAFLGGVVLSPVVGIGAIAVQWLRAAGPCVDPSTRPSCRRRAPVEITAVVGGVSGAGNTHEVRGIS
jgi:uncharacterized membrane protein YeaQ/YmgE (transglycosylase-associated protein family)